MILLGSPWLLLLAVLWVAGVIFTIRDVRGMTKGRKILAGMLRSAVGVLLILAIADPKWVQPNRGVATLFVVDRSDSIPLAEKRRSEQFIQSAIDKMGSDDRYGIIAFGRSARVDVAPSPRSPVAPIRSVTEGGATDLASALRLAAASFPEGKARRIVLLSDGNETQGDATEPAQALAADGIVIDAVKIGDAKTGAEVAALELQIPGDVRVEQRFEMRAVIESNIATLATLEIDINDQPGERMDVKLVPGRNAILIPQRIPREGLLRYRMRVIPEQDQEIRNNVAFGFASIRGKPRVLVMQRDVARDELVRALRRTGINTDLRGPGGFPFRTTDLLAYDAVILNDIPGSAIPERDQKLLQALVREAGVGLVMIGGEDSFLPGGWYGTPVAEALPVDLNIRQRKTFPSTSVAILVDCSGSMSAVEDGVQKLQLAIRAAERTVQLLGPRDRISVAGSSDGIDWVVKGQELSNRQAAINQIRRLEVSGGGIYIGPTVQAADTHMRQEPSKVRHVIILADGADSTDFQDAFQRAAAMRAAKITTSVVAIGDGEFVPQLKTLAVSGGGNFYLAQRASQLPAIFTQDTALMARSAIEEGNFNPILVAGDAMLGGIDALPGFNAYCLVDSRPLSKIILKTPKEDPLLVRGQYGLGTTLAFTSDAQSRWARAWVGWAGFDAFWNQAIRAVMRRVGDGAYQPRIESEQGQIMLRVEGQGESGITARLIAPNGESEEVTLRKTGPGEFAAPLETDQVGNYLVSIAEERPGGPPIVTTTAFGAAYPAEYRSLGANPALLGKLNRLTGGRNLASAAEAFRPAQRAGQSEQPLLPWLLGIACGLMLIDIAARRLAFSMPDLAGQIGTRLAASRRRDAPKAVGTKISGGLGAKTKQKDAAKVTLDPVPPQAPPEKPKPKAQHSQGQAAATSLLEKKRQREQDKEKKD